MEFLSPELNNYIEKHSEGESEILKKINRETQTEVLMPRMISGHFQGRLLAFLVAMLKPKNILEIGTYTGYSAICLAENLPEEGKIITIDINEELESRVRGYFLQSGFNHKIDYRIGAALDIIPTIDQKFDLIFIDADKKNNLNYYNLGIEKLNQGGFIIIDNVLWSGKVVEQNPKKDKELDMILALNDFVHEDKRVRNLLLPVRDGLMVVQKV